MNLLSICLRPATERDECFLRLVYAESRREELDQVAWPEGAREAFLHSQFDAQAKHYTQHYPGAEFLVIEAGGEPVGRLYLHRVATEIRIMDIALLPAARGQGIGTSLLKALLDEGRDTSRLVSIHVEKFNRALHLYERLGFRQVEDRGVYLLLHWLPAAAASA